MSHFLKISVPTKTLSIFKGQPHKMDKNNQFVGCCFNVFDHFVGLALKGLSYLIGPFYTNPN